jgi:phage-related baseplate assembly protein
MAEAPQFLITDTATILNEIIADFETRTGRVLQPAHVERLLLNSLAYRESLVRHAIQYSAEQNLVEFANGLSLDFLGDLVGVTRLASSFAQCTLEFTLVDGHGGSLIPRGTRVATNDGRVAYSTTEDIVVDALDTTATVTAEANIAGAIGNGYIAGQVTQLLDPLSYVSSVTNTTETDGGADQESDVELRERIQLAPGRFSNAGSRGAYEYFARSANPSIIDVAVGSVDPGTVQIYILMNDGEDTPPEVVDQVLAACNDERVRPLTDLVTAFGATAVEYEIEFTIRLYTYADAVTTQAAAQSAVDALVLAKRQNLGQDVPLSQVIEALMVPGVYSAEPTTSFSDVVVEFAEFAKCTSVVLTIGTPVDE